MEEHQGTFSTLAWYWLRLQQASRQMVAGPAPTWPWHLDQETFLAQQARRDRVQATGGRFAAEWRARAGAVRALVASHPALFPEFHVVPKKGQQAPDPAEYNYAGMVTQRILDNLLTSGDV